MQHPGSEFPQVSQRCRWQRILCHVIAQGFGSRVGLNLLLRRNGKATISFIERASLKK
jgi:hypothetical protein